MTKDEMLANWKALKKVLYTEARRQKTPFLGTFELTPLCNLQCKMCYVRLSPQQAAQNGRMLTADEWIDLGRQAADAGTLELLLTGGEIFSRADFPLIYRELSQMGFRIILFTNATLIDDAALALLESSPPSEIGITMYGASPETYQKVCGDGKWFDLALKNTERLVKTLGSTQIALRGTYIRDNVGDIDAMKEFAGELGIPFRISHATMKGIRGASTEIEKFRLSLDEIKELNRIHLGYVDESDGTPPENYTGAMTCNAALCEYAVAWNGRMLPCLSFSTPYVDLTQNTFKGGWEQLLGLRDGISVPKQCHDCDLSEYCGWCPAIVQAERGTYKETHAACMRYI